MARITHPSMKKVREEKPRNEPQSYVVDDATEEFNPPSLGSQPQPQPQMEQKSEQKHEDDTVSRERKSTLESLIFLGAATKTVEVGGREFKLSTLTHREHNSLMKRIYQFGDGADLFLLRTLTLAYALKSVDGTALEDIEVPDADQYKNIYDRKLDIIDSMQMKVITRLYDEYSKLSESVEKDLDGEEVKK